MITLVDFIDEQIKFYGIEDTSTNRNKLRKKFTRSLQMLGFWDNAKTVNTKTKPAKVFTEKQILQLQVKEEEYLLKLSNSIDYNYVSKIVSQSFIDRELAGPNYPKPDLEENFLDKLDEDAVIKAMIKSLFFEKFDIDAERWYKDKNFIKQTYNLLENYNPDDYEYDEIGNQISGPTDPTFLFQDLYYSDSFALVEEKLKHPELYYVKKKKKK